MLDVKEKSISELEEREKRESRNQAAHAHQMPCPTSKKPASEIEELRTDLRRMIDKFNTDVMRIHLKLRAYDRAQTERIEAIEQHLGIPPTRKPRN